ncbi:MAG: hypothetical protein PHW60_08265 [Kiritimatiellae bacterium]|nr:hypothetical protein [Kiritimatiellia bacterium]
MRRIGAYVANWFAMAYREQTPTSPGAASYGLVPRRWFLFLLICYCLAGIALAPAFRYALDTDGIAYISEALKFADGDWFAAVNGHWSPLLPLVLSLLFRLGIPETLAVKVAGLGMGLLTLIGVWRLSARFKLSDAIRKAVLITLGIMILNYALIRPTPDLMAVGLLVFYLTIVFDPGYGQRRYAGMACGFLGACGYFAKAYILPFFVLHFSVMNLFYFCACRGWPQRKKIIGKTVAGFAMLAIVTLPWVGALSAKYHAFSLSTAGAYNWSMRHPDSPGELVPGLGFLPPAHTNDISAWDDPALLPKLPWSPWDSPQNMQHMLRVIMWNGVVITLALVKGSVLAIPIVLLGFLVFAVRWRSWRDLPQWLLPLVTVILFPSGYVLLDVNDRLLWIMNVLILFLGAQLLAGMLERCADRRLTRFWIIVFCLTFAWYPVTRIGLCYNNGKELPVLAEKLRVEYGVGGRLASHNRYRESLFLAYFMKAQYCNTPRHDWSEAEIVKQLQALNVDCYIVWNDGQPPPRFLEPYREVTQGAIPALRVYALRADGAPKADPR